MEYLLDTNSIVQILKGNADLANFISPLNAVIDATIYVETLQGQKTNAEKIAVKKFLNSFDLIFADDEIFRETVDLIDKYSITHNLVFPNALIAATCIKCDLTLITYNQKDFRYIQKLKILTPSFPQI